MSTPARPQAPQTLLQMAGAPETPPPLAGSAVVLVDCQNEYVDGALPLPHVREALQAAAALVEKARAAGAPVIHIAHKGRPGGLFDREGHRGGIAGEVQPLAGEEIVEKTLPNSFAGTRLEALLNGLGRPALIIGGFMTHMCVSSTARAALDLGYRTTIVAAATATRDLPAAAGTGVIDAASLQAASLAALADRFAIVIRDAGELA